MKSLKEHIDCEKLPKHVAIIMDGNGRWAKTRGEERSFGHKNAITAVRNAINTCYELGISYLSLYAFSSENWNRPKDEVNNLMTLLSETLISEADDIFNKGLRIHVIGEIENLPTMVREQIENMIEHTKNNTKANLLLALSYGSHKEIVNAVKQIGQKLLNNELNLNEIDESCIENHLYTKNIPSVDLLIRTSGEVRVSNFLLWQIAYAEMQFLDILWPDFSKEDFYTCIYNYQQKERRFGLTSEQMSKS